MRKAASVCVYSFSVTSFLVLFQDHLAVLSAPPVQLIRALTGMVGIASAAVWLAGAFTHRTDDLWLEQHISRRIVIGAIGISLILMGSIVVILWLADGRETVTRWAVVAGAPVGGLLVVASALPRLWRAVESRL